MITRVVSERTLHVGEPRPYLVHDQSSLERADGLPSRREFGRYLFEPLALVSQKPGEIELVGPPHLRRTVTANSPSVFGR